MTRIVADIGGTTARFALATLDGRHGPVTRFRVRDLGSFPEAVTAYITAFPDAATATEMAVAAAGPVEAEAVSLTNAPWRIAAREVSARLGGIRTRVFNDLEAVALAVPHLAGPDLEAVFPGHAPPGSKPMIALNVGTGLGAALAVPVARGWTALASEAGHMRFAAATRLELELLGHLESYEQVLSGPGVAALAADLEARLRAAGPSGREMDGDPGSFVELFSDLLGRLAGDLVLATGAWGGAYLCGGVLAAWGETVDPGRLHRTFCRKGAMTKRMRMVPVHRILCESPALIGLARAAL